MGEYLWKKTARPLCSSNGKQEKGQVRSHQKVAAPNLPCSHRLEAKMSVAGSFFRCSMRPGAPFWKELKRNQQFLIFTGSHPHLRTHTLEGTRTKAAPQLRKESTKKASQHLPCPSPSHTTMIQNVGMHRKRTSTERKQNRSEVLSSQQPLSQRGCVTTKISCIVLFFWWGS